MAALGKLKVFVRFAKPLFWLLVLALAAWGVRHFFFPPPERVIRQRLEKLAAAISEQPTGNISKVANVNRIGSFFHPNVTINLEGFGRDLSSVQGRGELEQMAMGVRQNGRVLNVHFSNLHVQTERGSTNASALVTAEVSVKDQNEPMVQDVRLNFERMDRAWLIRSAEPMKSFKVE